MFRARRSIGVVLGAAALTLCGCGSNEKEGPSPRAPKATTPEAAIHMMQKAAIAKDREAWLACFHATGREREILDAMGDYLFTMVEFDEAMRKAYGDEAVQDLQMAQILDEMRDEKLLEKVTIKVEGDTATATKEGATRPINLIRTDGGWKIRADTLGRRPGQGDAERALKMFRGMAKTHRSMMDKIGKEGHTAETIQQEIARQMTELMAPMMPPPGTAPAPPAPRP